MRSSTLVFLAVALEMLYFGATVTKACITGTSSQTNCNSPLGMESRAIPDAYITASSEWNSNHGPSNARLNKLAGGGKTGAWSAKTNDVNQWIQVLFPQVTNVTSVAIQGRSDLSQWVTKFKVAYSLDGAYFLTQDKEYIGNGDRNGVVVRTLEVPLKGRAFRIIPVQWYGHISLRMELYGCHLTSVCASPLGMEDYRIGNPALTASSEWDSNHAPANARLNRPAGGSTAGAWSAKVNDANQWFKVTFPSMVKVTAIGIQGRQDMNQWVTKFKVAYSKNGADFNTQSKEYAGNSNRDGIVINDLQRAVQGRAFRIIPVQWYGHISLRMELYGCHVDSNCAFPLGMENRAILESALSASSEWNGNHEPTNARFNRPAGGGKTGAWSARTNDNNQWIQVTFIDDITKVTAVGIQGRQDMDQWVTKFKIAYSVDGTNFIAQHKVYSGNQNRNGMVVNSLVAPVKARAIRILPVQWYRHISLRLELYGCNIKSGCASSLGLRNQQLPDSALSASTEWDSNHGPTNARLDKPAGGGKTGAWSARSNNVNQWIQVTFPGDTRVTAVGIQGRSDMDQWVTSYRVSYSHDGINFLLESTVYTGNRDRNSVVVQNLVRPVAARWIRINPVTWHNHISLRMEVYGCHITSICASPLGMENRGIPDSAISASSQWDGNHGPTNARFNRPAGGGKTGAWSPRTNDNNPWIQVTFIDDITKVTAVGIQGRQDTDQWVTKFKIAYSVDGTTFTTQDEVYSGNHNRNDMVINSLVAPVEARAIRILPVQWYSHISLRLELYGCNIKSECSSSLGLRNQQLPDSSLSASSEWDSNHGRTNARLDKPAGGGKTGAWSAKSNNVNQWIQVTFLGDTRVTALGIQGRSDLDQWVTSYRVSYSHDGISFLLDNTVYTGNKDRNSVVVQNLVRPIVARAIRINPVTWHNHISLRMEVYGCQSNCTSPLGMENRAIPDSAISASSQWDSNHSPTNARFNRPADAVTTGAWSARTNDNNQWIQVTFIGDITNVTAVGIQGRQDMDQWVTKFKIAYSVDGTYFIAQNKVYSGNHNRNGMVVNSLAAPVTARAIRILPVQWYSHISLRLELYGCDITSECSSSLGLRNQQLPDSSLSASSEWDSNHGPTNARLDKPAGGGKTGAWSAKSNNISQWIQVSFPRLTRITAVGIQGRSDMDQWVTGYRVWYSVDGINFHLEGEAYTGNRDRNSVVVQNLVRPVMARAIRINPVTWHNHISLRMEVYGCPK